MTALNVGQGYTTVYLNSNNQKVDIKSVNGLVLAVNQQYKLVIDGNCYLVSAEIVK